ncbi:MAG TPA: zinc metalloprotease HtpX [Candidatus Binatia bacterium]|nr:zinc metalloprotease HtpX [Candidatus Binatia bacterium]
MSSALKTTLLLASLTALILIFGDLLGGSQGVKVAFVIAAVMNLGSYWFSDKIVLMSYRAQPIAEGEAPELYQIVRRLSQKANVPMPRIYRIPTDSPNAFATGRNPQHAVVAVTDGILRLLSREELEGVLAHELGHVFNRDILVSSIAATLAGAVMMIARMAQWSAMFGGMSRDDRGDRGSGLGLFLMAILAPIAAMLIQLAVSRAREYGADDSGARLCGNPEALASALEKLAIGSGRIPLPASPQTAHLFIVNPLSGRSFANLFSTHPPIEERIRRLRQMRIGAA